MRYLTFNNLSDFLAHVEGWSHAHLPEVPPRKPPLYMDISSTNSTPNQYGLYTATFYAALSWAHGDYIAACAVALTQALSMELEHEQAKVRARIHEKFDAIRADLEAQGWTVERGRWSYELPRELRGV